MLAGEGWGARFRLPASGTRGDYTRVVLRPGLGGPAAAGDDAARMGALGIPVACTATWFQPGEDDEMVSFLVSFRLRPRGAWAGVDILQDRLRRRRTRWL